MLAARRSRGQLSELVRRLVPRSGASGRRALKPTTGWRGRTVAVRPHRKRHRASGIVVQSLAEQHCRGQPPREHEAHSRAHRGAGRSTLATSSV